MDDEKIIECKGMWTLGNTQTQANGTLFINPNGKSHLIISGPASKLAGWSAISNSNKNIIHGKTTNREATLLNCTSPRHSFYGSNSYSEYRINVETALVGHHFNTEADVKFKSMSVNFSYLREWFDIFGIEFLVGNLNNLTATATYKSVIQPAISVGNLFKLTFYNNPDALNLATPQHLHSITIAENPVLHFEFPEPESLEKIINIITHFKKFVTLGITKPTPFIFLSGLVGSTHKDLPIDVYLSRYKYADHKIDEDAYELTDQKFFLYSDVQSNLKATLEKWFSIQEILEPVIDRFFGNINSDGMYLEDIFLNYFGAIEAIFTYQFPSENNDLPKTEFRKNKLDVLTTIKTHLSNNLAKWLNPKIDNYLTSKNRFKKIIEKFFLIFHMHQMDYFKNEKYISRIVDTRNYLTHLNPNNKHKKASNTEIISYHMKLRVILHVFLWAEIGFDQKTINKMIMNNNLYKWILLYDIPLTTPAAFLKPQKSP
jgi:hypothetical protein